MIKVSIHQQYIAIIIIYALNIESSKSIKQILKHLKGEVDYNIIILGDSISPFNNGKIIQAKNLKRNIEIQDWFR
jgi:hypothetical protein